MNYKINCQLVILLLNNNNEYSNKYTTYINNNLDFMNILDEYYESKDMRTIMIDKNNQSICFSNPDVKVSYYDKASNKVEVYTEEVHIHCNDLEDFDRFVNYLYSAEEFKNSLVDTSPLPHYEFLKKLNESELVIEPMTNEKDITRSLVNYLAQKDDETVFRAMAIRFCKLVDNSRNIDSDLIHKLNKIYQNDVINNNELFFSSDIANKILSTIEKEEDYTITRHMLNNNIDLNNNVLEYTKSESEEYNF